MEKSFLLLLMVTFSACQQTSNSETITEEEIIDFLRKYDKAWNSKDTVTVNELMGDQYIYFTSRGELNTRQSSLSSLGAPYYVLHAAERTEIETFISGNTATTSSLWIGQGSWKGEEFKDNQRCGLTLQKINGTIKVIAEHCVEITK